MTTIADNLRAVRAAIDAAAVRAGRAPSSVALVAVTKTHPEAAVAEAYAAGQRDFGENYASEMKKKREGLAGSCPDIRWHFIGRVQDSNTKEISRAHLVHGVGSISQAEALAKRGAVSALLQVNVSDEESKNGFLIDEIPKIAHVVSGLIQVRGLMCIPAADRPARPAFARLRALRDELRRAGHDWPELSMGMSADFEDAIAEGATLVRIGTAIFGAREAQG